MPETIRVLIADDEAEIRAALADLIASEDSLELVGAARDAGEAVELAGANRPDVALLDVRMPGGGGLRAARGILRRSPETRVLALSAYQDNRAGARIKRTVGNLGAAARLDRMEVEVPTQPVPVGELLERAASEFPQHEPVEVEVEANESEVEIALSDRGAGIPTEERQVIFEAFTQGDASTTRSHQGLGIGLYLVHLIMVAHGGRVGVIGRNEGGSTFVLAFPASPSRIGGALTGAAC